ncbi:hypothetical protein C8F04DRAFT_1233129 [Mycena alexandri]|uniref:Uncharacterized protein n=1 Tax=Mycena alexandri TaxID=1745969 RepID=A0AAD6SZH3_9AGAR|nr:hypothetical protein C8F04DRAFT_1233129 [Mycena alexandri]
MWSPPLPHPSPEQHSSHEMWAMSTVTSIKFQSEAGKDNRASLTLSTVGHDMEPLELGVSAQREMVSAMNREDSDMDTHFKGRDLKAKALQFLASALNEGRATREKHINVLPGRYIQMDEMSRSEESKRGKQDMRTIIVSNGRDMRNPF